MSAAVVLTLGHPCSRVGDTTVARHQYHFHRTQTSSYDRGTTARDLSPVWAAVTNPAESEVLGRNNQLVYEVETLMIIRMHD